MAGLNDDGQWIILMSFVVCVSLFFLALLVNESTLVGQSTAESVLDFPKHDIQELKVDLYRDNVNFTNSTFAGDIVNLSLARRNAIVSINNITTNNSETIIIHYNNGVTGYNETVLY